MLVERSGPRSYLVGALEGAPEVFEYSLRNLTNDEADFRPDAARFTLREMIAHLADWEPIFLQRLQHTRDENEPFLPDIDEGQIAIEHDYAHSDFNKQLQLFRKRRAQLVAFVRELSLDDWQRTCQHERAGHLTLEGLTLLITLHDAYHVRQVIGWRTAFEQTAAQAKVAYA